MVSAHNIETVKFITPGLLKANAVCFSNPKRLLRDHRKSLTCLASSAM